MKMTPGAENDAFVITEEAGLLCIIPSAYFRSAWLDSIAAGRIMDAGEVCLADVDLLAEDILELKEYLQGHIEDVLQAAELFEKGVGWNNDVLWERLRGENDDDYTPDDWQPTDEQLQRVSAEVGEYFYESRGLRDTKWSSEIPASIVDKYGKHYGGFFGDYFGFEPHDRDDIRKALKALGYAVLDKSDVIPWTNLW